MVASPAFSYPSVVNAGVPGQIGTGVDVTAVPPHPRRVRRRPAPRADRRGRATTRRRATASTRSSSRWPSPATPASTRCSSKYWNAWQDVANAPENLATRQALVQAAGALADGFHSLSSQLTRSSADGRERHRHARRGRLDRPPGARPQRADRELDRGRRRAERPARQARRPDRQAGAARQRLDGGRHERRDRRHLRRRRARDRHDARRRRSPRATSRASSPASSSGSITSATRCCRLQVAARRDRERGRHEDERPAPHRLRPERHRRRRLLRRVGHDRGHDRRRPRRSLASPGRVAAAKAPGEYGDATVALAIGDLRATTRSTSPTASSSRRSARTRRRRSARWPTRRCWPTRSRAGATASRASRSTRR